MNLDFVRIECDVTTEVPAQLTAILSEALQNFETHFKELCCSSIPTGCTSCFQRDECPYRMFFSQNLSADPEIIRLHQKPSLPFALSVKGSDNYSSTCTIGLVVIGTAVNFLDLFHASLLRMITTSLTSAFGSVHYSTGSYSLDYQGGRHAIPANVPLSNSVILLSGQHILYNTVHCDSVRLLLKSPLRLLSNGTITHRFDFAAFFRSQLRRCSSMCAYYGTGMVELDFVRLSALAQDVAVFDNNVRYTQPVWSHRRNKAGLIGSVECIGLIEPMYSILQFGSYFNAGKGATFGFGFYQTEVL